MKKSQDFTRLRLLIKEIYGIENIEFDTVINEFKTISEDNDYFIRSFELEFNIDMSSFPYYKYYEEDQFILLSIFRILFGTSMKGKKKLTVRHLLRVIQNKKWHE
ncbi:DUF1493 family protein [Algoriphagus pacificus]|uniref:DUF1493 family protein n=1 Tax=Algoriphagus pacificus TaxID=2811234 RepID=A0ABS3CK30_9BACT|nr:DUF1493 family protein [Algoriphagus pacificus]MBN7817458.1 DUF1493 family protein [Algoriphagus pacificus]